jgi:hypothetical protein
VPKSVEEMTVEEKKEIKYIERQIAAGKVGTPNVYVRQGALQDELNRRNSCYSDSEGPRKTEKGLVKLGEKENVLAVKFGRLLSDYEQSKITDAIQELIESELPNLHLSFEWKN